MWLNNYNLKDTIAAIATFPSTSALGVIKISGSKALSIVAKIFLPKNKKNIKEEKTYTLHYGWIVDRFSKEKAPRIIDEVLVSIMRGPYSYTREDVVEISSHGGIVVLNKILSLVLKGGGRLAQPGEFSYRAFIKGRIDLIQAQAILDIVEAKTERFLLSSTRQLKGDFSSKLNTIKDLLRNLVYKLEAYINFPDDQIIINLKELRGVLRKTKNTLKRFLEDSRDCRIFREGIQCVICGKANVGKSTLFNCLLKEERAIVTHIPATTRDVVEETINIKGLPVVISDTAGILEPKDFVDKKAIEKSYRKLKEADIVLFVLDTSQNLSKDDFSLWEKIKEKNVIFVINKIDLKKGLEIKKLKPSRKPIVRISALKHIGINKLEEAIFKLSYRKSLRTESNQFILSQWQEDILKRILIKIDEADGLIQKGYSYDFIILPLKESLEEIGKLMGENISEEILKEIFSKFCIGK